jgi:REP element-mobilizing transposase RayT
MRRARIKVPPEQGEAVYHCMSRTVNGEHLFDDQAKEVLRRLLRRVAGYCGLEIITQNVLSNHFHVEVRVPKKQDVSDQELLRRYRLLYPPQTAAESARLQVIEQQLAQDSPAGRKWRKQQLAMMGDLSAYMKLVKQRFSIWFNRTHHRFGTLWAERFKSVLLQPTGPAVLTVAAYIDLNAVRAGLVLDPKDYRFCGYAEAVAGDLDAQKALMEILGLADWPTAQAVYRQLLFGTGAASREQGATIPQKALEKVLSEGGQLPLSTVLRCRIRHFADGAVLGSRAFVEEQRAAQRLSIGRNRPAQPLPPVTNWGDLATLHRLHRPAFG